MGSLLGALGKAGRSGQDSASAFLNRESNALRATTDEDHYVSAVKRAAQASALGEINGDNREAVSAFISNQYLLNKTGGKRDLGDQFGKRGIFNQLGTDEGIQKFAAAGAKTATQTDAGTIVHGTSEDKVDYATYIDDAGVERFVVDDFGRKVATKVEDDTTKDTALLTKPDTALTRAKKPRGPLQGKSALDIRMSKASIDPKVKSVIENRNQKFSDNAENVIEMIQALEAKQNEDGSVDVTEVEGLSSPSGIMSIEEAKTKIVNNALGKEWMYDTNTGELTTTTYHTPVNYEIPGERKATKGNFDMPTRGKYNPTTGLFQTEMRIKDNQGNDVWAEQNDAVAYWRDLTGFAAPIPGMKGRAGSIATALQKSDVIDPTNKNILGEQVRKQTEGQSITALAGGSKAGEKIKDVGETALKAQFEATSSEAKAKTKEAFDRNKDTSSKVEVEIEPGKKMTIVDSAERNKRWADTWGRKYRAKFNSWKNDIDKKNLESNINTLKKSLTDAQINELSDLYSKVEGWIKLSSGKGERVYDTKGNEVDLKLNKDNSININNRSFSVEDLIGGGEPAIQRRNVLNNLFDNLTYKKVRN